MADGLESAATTPPKPLGQSAVMMLKPGGLFLVNQNIFCLALYVLGRPDTDIES